MILTIDIGNTRTKWGIFAAGAEFTGELKLYGVSLNADFNEAPQAWRGCSRAVLCNVAGEQIGQRVRAALQALNIPLTEVKASSQACGVHNRYDQPEKLGVDRWAAVIAAWQHYHQPCVVVSAGTAVTIDALTRDESGQGVFLGGMILPGIRLMQQSLLDATAGIKESMGDWQDFPTNTANALYTAAMTAAAGNVKGMAARLQNISGVLPIVIVSGGDAEPLAECLLGTIGMVNNLVIADNLVLQGLLLLEKASR